MEESERESRAESVNAGGGERVEESKGEWLGVIASQGKGGRMEVKESKWRGAEDEGQGEKSRRGRRRR